jgi:hypothetical protein
MLPAPERRAPLKGTSSLGVIIGAAVDGAPHLGASGDQFLGLVPPRVSVCSTAADPSGNLEDRLHLRAEPRLYGAE